jgi:hypothetical protein
MREFRMDQSRVFDSHGRGILFGNATLKLEYWGTGNAVRGPSAATVRTPGKDELT